MIRSVEAVGERVFEAVGRAIGRTQARHSLPADLLESETAYLAVFDTPGALGRDVQVRYNDGGIDVRADRFRDHREGFETRFSGRGLALDGRVDLPETVAVDPESATATLFENGTLRVRIPKAEA